MSRRLHFFNMLLRHTARPRLARTPTPEVAARDMERGARFLFRPPPFLRHVVRPGGMHWFSQGPCAPRRVILWFHGGGYVAGSPRTHRAMLGRLSRLAGVEVCAPDYRLAQEARFPAAVEDARAAWERLMAEGYRPEDVVIGGDSAGGGLAAGLLAWLCQRGTPPAGAVLFSPWTDLTLSGASLTENAEADALLPVGRIGELAEIWLGEADPADPRASPLWADFPTPPPVFIAWSQTEILRDDAARLADRLEQAGSEVRRMVHPVAPHVWPYFLGWFPEARQTLRRAAVFVRECLRPVPAKPGGS
ncbi:alpha/beta hydrolase [Allosediminivita pacifica]|uniref:Acetyl esterase/lipase n=1 Tax=Allosediminivita pacifica TaxID=1267769 RepID=A0A2T6ANZ2_9RHOB|nr:alpha/beta hydrolase [Allosediminivita pacifica]PTX45535.1 acetyl esterase/lipase [Allosediminivita pacifica]GGB20213.1 hydrolase [Allosediminivita pacifica]